MQIPPEPVDLSSGDHPHCEPHGPEKRSEGEASSQEWSAGFETTGEFT